MSRGNNRNKVNGPNAKKSTKGTSGNNSSLVYIALGAIITVALCMLLFITSSSSFKGALTMTGPQFPVHNTGPLHFQPQPTPSPLAPRGRDFILSIEKKRHSFSPRTYVESFRTLALKFTNLKIILLTP